MLWGMSYQISGIIETLRLVLNTSEQEEAQVLTVYVTSDLQVRQHLQSAISEAQGGKLPAKKEAHSGRGDGTKGEGGRCFNIS